MMLACGCGDHRVEVLRAPPSELKAITYNMYYGLAADLLPENLSIASLSASARAIVDAVSLTDFGCRLRGAARQIVVEAPDVIGIQEGLIVAFTRDRNDRADDEPLVDFLRQLVDDIEDEGGPRYRIFQRDNAVIEDALPVGGIRIGDRGAILVHPRFDAQLAGSITFTTLQPASAIVPGTNGVVVRGALWVRVPFPSGTIDFFNTHLQSGDAVDIRAAQSDELLAWIEANRAPGGTVVLTADLNDVPGSPPWQTLTRALVDTYAVVGTPPGFTAYQPQTLTNATDQSTMRIDFVMIAGGDVEESRVILNSPVEPCNLWPSDHFGVVSRFRTAASQSPAPPSE